MTRRIAALLLLLLACPGWAASPEFDAKVAEARALLGEGKTAPALAAFRAALRIEPDDAAVNNALGAILNREGRYAEALVHAEAAVRAKPDDGRYRYNRGIVLAEHGRFEDAVADFDFAIRAQPDQGPMYLERGAALASLDRMDAARRDWAKAREVDPQSVWADWYSATGDLIDGRYDLAAAAIDRVQAAEPSFAPALLWRAIAHGRTGKAIAIPVQESEAWPAPVLDFYAGRLSAERLLAVAEADLTTGDARRLGEALYFAGQHALIAGQPDVAARYFRRALAVEAPRHVWKISAERELARLGGNAG